MSHAAQCSDLCCVCIGNDVSRKEMINEHISENRWVYTVCLEAVIEVNVKP